MVERICGVSQEHFVNVAEALLSNSGRDRSAAFAYAVAWTQHNTGIQMIGCCALLQLLLGNIGRPGGGILALRGHATIQGSTDIATLYNLLPGYLPMPSSTEQESDRTLEEYLRHYRPQMGWWYYMPCYLFSLLKAWYGDAATPENDFAYDLVLRPGAEDRGRLLRQEHGPADEGWCHHRADLHGTEPGRRRPSGTTQRRYGVGRCVRRRSRPRSSSSRRR
jgi:formate dehydrogenase major subunit